MKTITVKYGGKTWENVNANNSGWIAPGAPKDLVEALKNAPRSGYTSKGCPIVKSDDGTNIYLGAAELHSGTEEAIHGTSGSGNSTKAAKIPLDIAKKTLAVKGLPEDLKTYFQGIVQEYEEAQNKKLEAAKSHLKDLGLTDEQIAATLALAK